MPLKMKLKTLSAALSAAFIALAALAGTAQAQKFEGLALTPPMGWNSWNTFQTQINEELIKGVADAMIANGMRDAGYNYIVLDDGWMAWQRDENGDLIAHPERFPSGMKALADYLHERGFQFGLYNCAGTKTCAGYPGSMGHEYQDARVYASFDVDYLKYDWCNTGTRDAKEAYTTMRDALYAAGRPVVFSMCEWGTAKPWLWAEDVGHLWRTTGDIMDCYDCTQRWSLGWKTIVDMQHENDVASHAGPGHWNDPDMMEVGNHGLTLAESRAHFSFWCVLAAPLIAGNDVRNMTPEITAILTNKEAIAIDQDPLGKQGFRFYRDDEREIWIRDLENGDVAVLVLNATDDKRVTEVDAKHLIDGYLWNSKEWGIRDIWQGKDLGTTLENPVIARELDPHDVMFFRLSKIR